MQSKEAEDTQFVRPKVDRFSRVRSEQRRKVDERRKVNAAARNTILDQDEVPRGRKRERQGSPGVHVYDERALSHSPESELYLDEISNEDGELENETHQPYEYSPLSDSEVRLLCITPGLLEDHVYCALKRVPLASIIEKPLNYQALSYAWGPRTPTQNIYLCNVEDQDAPVQVELRFLRIRQNLYWALKRLRHHEVPTWLWVDALCIDQSSATEKSHQIPKMPQIYSSAWNVAIWLGEDGYNGYSTKSIKSLIEKILNLKTLDSLLKPALATDDLVHSLSEFCGLLRRPWFNRRWVIQEIACAKRLSVRYGDQVESWVNFADAMELMLQNHDRFRQVCAAIQSGGTEESPIHNVNTVGLKALLQLSRGVFQKSSTGEIKAKVMDLESLIVAASSFVVSEPQDIIFALLYLANDVHSYVPEGPSKTLPVDFVSTDYSKNIIDLCSQLVQRCMQTQKSLNIILQPWLNHDSVRKEHAIPTWMLASAFGAGTATRLIGLPRACSYNASREVAMVAELQRSTEGIIKKSDTYFTNRLPANPFSRSLITTPGVYNGTLLTKGITLGIISEVDRAERVDWCRGSEIPASCLKMLGWNGNVKEGPSEQLWRTLVANRTADDKLAPQWYRRACASALTEISEWGGLPLANLSASGGAQPSMVEEYMRRVRMVVQNRSVFKCQRTIDEGRGDLVGLSPADTHHRDAVCILLGCSVPVILRMDHESKEVMRVRGEAYVDGHMEGEIFAGKTKEVIEQMVTDFKIR
jgi:hypothetical protein